MTVVELLQHVEFLVDASGNKKAVVLEYAAWEELLNELEALDDAKEIQHLRELGEETIPWEQAKAELRAEGACVARVGWGEVRTPTFCSEWECVVVPSSPQPTMAKGARLDKYETMFDQIIGII
ncbi:MAG: hypothetical protein ACRESZ_18555 [Methylococcales bacterium]